MVRIGQTGFSFLMQKMSCSKLYVFLGDLWMNNVMFKHKDKSSDAVLVSNIKKIS